METVKLMHVRDRWIPRQRMEETEDLKRVHEG